jgi:hypothetical protein
MRAALAAHPVLARATALEARIYRGVHPPVPSGEPHGTSAVASIESHGART